MDRPSKMRDQKEKNVDVVVKSDLDKWKRRSIYGVHTGKLHPESTSKVAQERTSDSRDHIPYRDGKLRLARQRQQAYQKDSCITSNLSDGSISRYRRLDSDVNDRKFNTSELGEPKGGGNNMSTLRHHYDEASSSSQQQSEEQKKKDTKQRDQEDQSRKAASSSSERGHPKKS